MKPKNAPNQIKKLQYILENCLDERFLINPYFRISKITPEQVKKYRWINSNLRPEIILILGIPRLVLNIASALAHIVLSVLFNHQYATMLKSRKLVNSLFLSHAIAGNLGSEKTDQYFAQMPNYLQSKGQKVTIVYTNQTRTRYSRLLEKLRTKNKDLNILLIPKFLSPSKSLRFLFISAKLATRCMRIGISNLHSSPRDSQILFAATSHFFSRNSYNNYLIKESLIEIQSLGKPDRLLLTLEGHSYEQYVTDALATLDGKCRFVFYQHSPLVPGSVGITSFIQGLKKQHTILLTGKVYKQYLAKVSRTPKYSVVGSQKTEGQIRPLSGNNAEILLFTPEGTVHATKEFINLINHLVESNPSEKFVLRLHPGLRKNIKINFLIRKLQKHSSFELSSSSLHNDLSRSRYVFYRSSAVGVEALRSNAVLVFYSNGKDSELNPLSLVNNSCLVTANTNEVIQLLAGKHKKVDRSHRSRVSKNLFEQLNYSVLDRV